MLINSKMNNPFLIKTPSLQFTKNFRFADSKISGSISGQKIFATKLKKIFVFGTLSAFSYLCFVNMVGNKIEIICTKTPQNLAFIRKITEFRNGVYNKTVYFPFRIMEIIYGNIFDQREFCEYKREIIYNHQKENFALGFFYKTGLTCILSQNFLTEISTSYQLPSLFLV